jgi:pimeloyl-ACP methyl ester carboxylesterase
MSRNGSTTVVVDGTRLFVKEAGEGSPVLLIHPSGFDADTWGTSFDELARDHRVIAYDRRGFSRSVHSPIRDYHRHGEDAAAILSELGAAPATVVGYSGGGLAALDLAVNHHDAVASLVLIEPPLYGRKQVDLSLGRTFFKTHLLRRLKGDVAAAENFVRWTSGYAAGGTTWDEIPEDRKDVVRGNATALLEESRAPDPPSLARERLSSVKCPVTCVTGDLSQRWFHKTTRAVEEVIPQTRTRTISGSNHAFTFHKPVEIAAVIHEAATEPAVPPEGE